MRRRGCWANGAELDVQVHLMSSVFFFRFVHFCFITRVLFFSLSVFFFREAVNTYSISFSYVEQVISTWKADV